MADNGAFQSGTPATLTAGLTFAWDDVGSVLYPRSKRTVGADGAATDFLDKASRSDTYAATGPGTAIDVSAQGMSRFAIQVVKTGSVTSWTVALQISLNGTNYFTIATHDDVNDGDQAIVNVSFAPALYVRSNCTELTLGGATNVIATIVALP